MNYSFIVYVCIKIIFEFYVYNYMVLVFNIVCSENCVNLFLNMKWSLLKFSYFVEMFWILIGDVVVDGGFFFIKYFDLFIGVGEDDFEKVFCNWILFF